MKVDGIQGISGRVGLGTTDSHSAGTAKKAECTRDAVMGSWESSPIALIFLWNRKHDHQ